MSHFKHVDGHWNRLNLLQNRGNLDASNKLTMMLNIGLDILGMDMGIMSSVVGNTYNIQYCTNRHYVGSQWNLSETFCDLTIHHNDVVDLAHISAEFQEHPAYQSLKIGSYIGIPFDVQGQVYGTIAFIKSEARRHDFTTDDIDFMIELSQIVTKVFNEMTVS